MRALPERLSPMHSALESLRPRWRTFAGMPAPIDLGDPAAERARAALLGLTDMSALPRMTLKGEGARAFLEDQRIAVPAQIYGWLPLEREGLIARTGSTEFFLEEGWGGETLTQLDRALTNPERRTNSVYRVLREDATLLLTGSNALALLAQTCGVDFGRPASGAGSEGAPRLVMTRIAGVSAAVLRRAFNTIPAYQVWTDASFGIYLWDSLLEIAEELGGGPVGLGCLFPDLAAEG